MRRAGIVLALSLVCLSPALGEEARAALRGRWIATAGQGRTLGGTWSAAALPGDPDAATGSWALLGPAGQVLLDGTWSARRSPPGWQGTWAARTRQGALYSGTWRADARRVRGKTFEDLLRDAGAARLSGTWRSGRAHGNWWLLQ